MKLFALFLTTVSLTVGATAAALVTMPDPPQPPVGWATDCKVVEVYDGDTVTIEVRRKIRVRLLNAWAPEIRTRDADEKRRGLAARDHLKQQAEGRDAVLFVPGQEKLQDIFTFGRALGYVYVDGKSLSQLQREAGHATAEKE